MCICICRERYTNMYIRPEAVVSPDFSESGKRLSKGTGLLPQVLKRYLAGNMFISPLWISCCTSLTFQGIFNKEYAHKSSLDLSWNSSLSQEISNKEYTISSLWISWSTAQKSLVLLCKTQVFASPGPFPLDYTRYSIRNILIKLRDI